MEVQTFKIAILQQQQQSKRFYLNHQLFGVRTHCDEGAVAKQFPLQIASILSSFYIQCTILTSKVKHLENVCVSIMLMNALRT